MPTKFPHDVFCDDLNVSKSATIGTNATVGGTLAVTGAVTASAGLSIGGNTANAAGAGFTGTGTICASSVEKIGNVYVTRFLIDLTGLNSSAAGDIIGGNGLSASYFTQITTAVNGVVWGGSILVLETPAGGEPDIDLYSATEATGAEDAAISSLAETALMQSAADLTAGTRKELTAPPAADEYLYLVGSGGGTDATYTAGRLLIELYGYVA